MSSSSSSLTSPNNNFTSLVDRATISHKKDDYISAINAFILNLSQNSSSKDDFKLAHLCLERIECNISSSTGTPPLQEPFFLSSEEESTTPFYMSLVDAELDSISSSIGMETSTMTTTKMTTTTTTKNTHSKTSLAEILTSDVINDKNILANTTTPRTRSKSVQSHLAAVRRAHEEQAIIVNKRKSSLLNKQEKVKLSNTKQRSFLESIQETRKDLMSNLHSFITLFSTESITPSINDTSDADLTGVILSLLKENEELLFVSLPPITSALNSGSLGVLCRDFMERCTSLLRRSVDNPSLVNQLMDEIYVAESHIHEILLNRYPQIPSSTLWNLSLRATIQEWIWNSPLLRGTIYLGTPKEKDPFSLISIEHGWVNLLRVIFEDSFNSLPDEIMILDSNPTISSNPFGDIIGQFRSLPSLPTPLDKLQCVFLSLKDLCMVLEDLSGNIGCFGCDDIILYMSYIIIISNIPFLEMEITLLTKTIPPELIIGECGFALATLQSSLDVVKVKFNKYF